MQNYKEKTTVWDTVTMTRFVICSALAFVLCNAIAMEAHAVGTSLCNMIGQVMGGGVARAIGTIGILMVGVGATLGKVSWTLALTVAIGIAAMFGGSYFMGFLAGTTACFM